MKINICAVQLATRPIWVSWERWVGFRSLDLGEINFPLHALYPSPLLLVLGYRYILDLKQISFTWFISFSSPPSTRIQIYQTQRRYPSYDGYPSPLLLLLGYRYTKPRGDILHMLDILLLSSRIQERRRGWEGEWIKFISLSLGGCKHTINKLVSPLSVIFSFSSPFSLLLIFPLFSIIVDFLSSLV